MYCTCRTLNLVPPLPYSTYMYYPLSPSPPLPYSTYMYYPLSPMLPPSPMLSRPKNLL